MNVKYAVYRKVALASGSAVAFPVRLFGNQEAAERSLGDMNRHFAIAFGDGGQRPGFQLSQNTPAGPVPVGKTLAQFCVDLFCGGWGLDHSILTMPEHESDLLVVEKPGLVDASGRPV